MKHDVTVLAGLTELIVDCSCDKRILDKTWERSFSEINAAVTRHYALETDDFPGLRSVFMHIEDVQSE